MWITVFDSTINTYVSIDIDICDLELFLNSNQLPITNAPFIIVQCLCIRNLKLAKLAFEHMYLAHGQHAEWLIYDLIMHVPLHDKVKKFIDWLSTNSIWRNQFASLIRKYKNVKPKSETCNYLATALGEGLRPSPKTPPY